MRTLLTRALPAAAVIAAAGLGGFVAYGRLAGTRVPMTMTSAPASQGAPQHADASTTARPIPDTLPDIAFTDRVGATRHLSDWKGHPLLVNFWATWCGPCQDEIPLLQHLSRDRAAQGLQVIGVAVDSRAAVLAYAQRAAIQYPLLIGEQPGLKAVQALGMDEVFPFSVFVDASGRIVTLKVGALRADQATLILDRLNDLDQGRVGLDAARREISDGMAKLAVARNATPGSRF